MLQHKAISLYLYQKAISTRFTLGKHERLKSRKLLEQLFREGSSFFIHPIKVYYQFSALPLSGPLQAGFGVSARVFKKAVDRNRIKRLMREAYRLQKPMLLEAVKLSEPKLAAFFLFVGKELPEYEVVKKKMASVLERLGKEVDKMKSQQ